MKLSEAILLGDTLKKADPASWLSVDGSCGCAFGGALMACGITGRTFGQDFLAIESRVRGSQGDYEPGVYGENIVAELNCVKRLWPWITAKVIRHISYMYFKVANGTGTLEEIAEYVRSVEPKNCASAITQDSALSEVPDKAELAPA